jgi:TetR/AcrR family transcriptional regulator
LVDEQSVTGRESALPKTVVAPTRLRILDSALDLFGSRGFEAVSLDEIAAAVGIAKQTVLYWFASKDELLRGVVAYSSQELIAAAEAAVRNSGEGFSGIEAVVKAVFRPAVRRPALLGLVRELNRLGPDVSAVLTEQLGPLVDRAVSWMSKEMDAGRLRRTDPRLALSLTYATVVGVATEPEALRIFGWEATPVGLRHLRTELLAFLSSALAPPIGDGIRGQRSG